MVIKPGPCRFAGLDTLDTESLAKSTSWDEDEFQELPAVTVVEVDASVLLCGFEVK